MESEEEPNPWASITPDQLSRPILYVVAFSSSDDFRADYSPIVVAEELTADGATLPHLLGKELVPALPALWYCLHLPKTVHDLVDIPLSVLGGYREFSAGHNLLLLPMDAVESVLAGPFSSWPRTLLIGPDSERDELARICAELNFDLPPVCFSDLSAVSLTDHWSAIKAMLVASLPGPPGPELRPVQRVEAAGIELPLRRTLRQLGTASADLPSDLEELLASALYAQAFQDAMGGLEREGCSAEEAEVRVSEEVESSARTLRLPITVGIPGAAPRHARRYAASGPEAEVPEGFEMRWPGEYVSASDREIERSAAALMVTHQAVARDSIGVLLPECPPEAFSILAELEQHCARGARPSGVRRLMKRLDDSMAWVWEDPLSAAMQRASSLDLIGDFPLGLVRPPGRSDPLSFMFPTSSRPLIPMIRTLPAMLSPRTVAELHAGFRVLVVECILPTDPVGQASRRAWRAISEMFSPGDARSSMIYREALSVDALRSAIADARPDVLVISAHGFSRPDQNVAGIMVGHEPSLGIDLGPLPPLVILSACHVSPRGTGAVTVADLLLREGATAVLGTLVPVDVAHNAMLMNRLFLYMTRVLAGEEDHASFRDVWHRVQTSNAIHDVTWGNPRALEWFMARRPGRRSPHEQFKNEYAVGRLRFGHVYEDSEEVLLDIARAEGTEGRVRGWLRGQGYVPESAFYTLIGEPDRIYLQSPARRHGV